MRSGWWLTTTVAGSTIATPLSVANHSRPALSRWAVGWKPVGHSILAMPSVTPNSCTSSRAVRFSETPLKLAAVARTTPRVVAIQKLPAASFKMAPIVSDGSPCRAPTAAHAVPVRRSKPASAVPTHNVPSASKCRQLPPANAPPNGPVTSAQVLLSQRKRPWPFTAHTLPSSGF